LHCFLRNLLFMGLWCQPNAHLLTWRTRVFLFVWKVTLDLFGLGDAGSSYATANIDLDNIPLHKSHRHLTTLDYTSSTTWQHCITQVPPPLDNIALHKSNHHLTTLHYTSPTATRRRHPRWIWSANRDLNPGSAEYQNRRCVCRILTNSKERSPSWEANISSANRHSPQFMEPEGRYVCSVCHIVWWGNERKLCEIMCYRTRAV
jgi:hypothetical protein